MLVYAVINYPVLLRKHDIIYLQSVLIILPQ
jgi:hypothetical protein